ncbi:unnamed protein product [Leptidea sinapis]|uniref:TIL domain-containing protein n=1 Tax=Leptidea sinapis TaxID=189913 RepID=A0A5E4QT60_9NEOP|nr:unnamed protein product [Leptidea sinapis]
MCIPIEKCPSCGGDFNATAGCGTFCTTCDNYQQHGVPCPLICELNGCDCKPNNVYDEILKKCVLPENCYKCSGKHEVFDECPQTCPPQICSSIWSKYAPCNPKHAVCTPSCVCENGYYKNLNNECTSTEDCLKCTGPHEYYSCGGACDNECYNLNIF